ncbi:MAG: GNAT family N-acetyltransferase [Acidimicrobiales bacterium]|nr:GNAT family N-acetyltransferase [Acidimicrobiales bacterium]
MSGWTVAVQPRETIVEIERIWTEDARQLADAVANLDSSWGTTVFDLVDGAAVLCGPGLYVNRALGLGLESYPNDGDIDLLESRSAVVGVRPCVEVCDATRAGLVELLIRRGYVEHGKTTAVVHDLSEVRPPDPAVLVEYCGFDDLLTWQETAAVGWDHDTHTSRRASDAFAAAAVRVDDPGLMVARSSDDGRLLGCATLKIGQGVATLGGMSTLPDERGRGVQAALICHRLRQAKDAGCRYAVSSATQGSASVRNLLRQGFQVSHTKTELTHF